MSASEGKDIRTIQIAVAVSIAIIVDDALRYGTVTENGTSVLWDARRALGVDAAGNTATGLQLNIRDGIIQTAFPVGVP